MPSVIRLFMIGLIFIGCGTDIEDLSKRAITKQHKTINTVQLNSRVESPKPTTISTTSTSTLSTISTLQGRYTLQEGNYSYNGKMNRLTHTVTYCDLVIEKLDSDDYGYYLVMQVEDLTPFHDFGMFHKQDNKFFRRIIYSPNITKDSNITIDSNISNPTLQTEITKDEIDIKQDKNTLSVNMKIGDGRINMIWTKESNSTTPTTEALKEAEHEYFKTYKERFNLYFKGI